MCVPHTQMYLHMCAEAYLCILVCVTSCTHVHASMCHGLFVCWLELTCNCLWFDSGLCFARVLFFSLLFFLYIMCVYNCVWHGCSLWDYVNLPLNFFFKSVYRVYIIAVVRWIFKTRPCFYFYLLPFGDISILCIGVCVVILARTDCKTRLLPKIFILEY